MKSGERAKDGLVGANVGNGGERIIRRLLGGPKHLRLERLRQGRERQLYWWQVKELIPRYGQRDEGVGKKVFAEISQSPGKTSFI